MKIKSDICLLLLLIGFLGKVGATEGKIILGMGPLLTIQTSEQSAPSPIAFSAGIGGNIPFASSFSFRPFLRFFTSYDKWENNTVLATEIENRVAIVPSFLLDLPLGYNLKLGENLRIGLSISPSMLFRYGFLAQGVSNTYTSDIEKINSWFYSDVHFLYPSLQIGLDYQQKNGSLFGCTLAMYLPATFTFHDAMVAFTLHYIPAGK